MWLSMTSLAMGNYFFLEEWWRSFWYLCMQTRWTGWHLRFDWQCQVIVVQIITWDTCYCQKLIVSLENWTVREPGSWRKRKDYLTSTRMRVLQASKTGMVVYPVTETLRSIGRYVSCNGRPATWFSQLHLDLRSNFKMECSCISIKCRKIQWTRWLV